MTQFQKITLFLLRLSLGWMFLYAGITQLMDPKWSAAGYLSGAKTFVGLYHWLLSSHVLPIINAINPWALTLLGLALILGFFVRLASILGAVLMLLYYCAILQFPHPNAHAYIVDEHIIYICALLFFAAIRAGRVWGIEKWCSNLPLCSKYPKLRKLIG
ncbi:DoxX family membrane protein [Candidatus Parcubacteria bacterium]|nr:DoxX family membrane protein [Candidatus Parcubacteria bacterium]